MFIAEVTLTSVNMFIQCGCLDEIIVEVPIINKETPLSKISSMELYLFYNLKKKYYHNIYTSILLFGYENGSINTKVYPG